MKIIRGMRRLRMNYLDGAAASTVRLWMKESGFPKPVKLPNGYSIVWDEAEVLAWIEGQFKKERTEK